MSNVVPMRQTPTDQELVEGCAGYLLCLKPGQEARLSSEQLRRLVDLARARLRERQGNGFGSRSTQ